MITIRHIAASLLLAAAAFSTASAQPKPGHLDEVIRQLDAASVKFKSAEASFEWDLFDHIVKETNSQSGTIFFEKEVTKEGTKTRMGAKVVTPQAQFIEFRNGLFSIYTPKTNQLTTVSAQKNQSRIETFLTLGFGGSGKDLLNAWQVSDLGTEQLDGVETAKLDLVPKDPSVRSSYPHILIWIDPARAVSLKQEIFMSSNDTKTLHYTNIRLNQKIDEKQYALNTNSKTTVDAH